jgi:hypothetical protein
MLDAKMAELAKEVVEGWDDEVSSDRAYIFSSLVYSSSISL